jgi:hypothetical protein
MEMVFFKNKKNTHPNLVVVITEKISAQKNEVSIFAGGETSSHFWPLRPQKLPEGGV